MPEPTSTDRSAKSSGVRTRQTSDVPPYDPKAVGRIGIRAQIRSVELLGAHFTRQDEAPLGSAVHEAKPDETGINISWKLSEDKHRLGCVITFGTVFKTTAPYTLVARFRLVFDLEGDDPLVDTDLENFVHWNGVLSAWPYWREYLSSTVNRAGLARFFAPVMKMPLPGMEE
jgi:hypothetical protein